MSVMSAISHKDTFTFSIVFIFAFFLAGDPKPRRDILAIGSGLSPMKKIDHSRPPTAIVAPLRHNEAPKSFIADTSVTIINATNRPVTVVNTRSKTAATSSQLRNGHDNDARETMDPCIELCRYPPEGTKGSMFIKSSDLLTLDSDTFLNDTVIDFYMSYLQNTELPKELAKKVFVFNTFFYSTLNKTQSKNLSPEERKLSSAKRRHGNVKRWTKGVDLFSKDFIVIPICQNSHWFLVIVCYPWVVPKVRGIDLNPPPREADDRMKKEGSPMDEDVVITPGPVGKTLNKPLTAYEDSEDGEDTGDGTQAKEEEVPSSSSAGAPDKGGIPATPNTPTRAAIYIFDSLRGSVTCAKVYQTVR